MVNCALSLTRLPIAWRGQASSPRAPWSTRPLECQLEVTVRGVELQSGFKSQASMEQEGLFVGVPAVCTAIPGCVYPLCAFSGAHTLASGSPVRKEADARLDRLAKAMRTLGIDFNPESYK